MATTCVRRRTVRPVAVAARARHAARAPRTRGVGVTRPRAGTHSVLSGDEASAGGSGPARKFDSNRSTLRLGSDATADGTTPVSRLSLRSLGGRGGRTRARESAAQVSRPAGGRWRGTHTQPVRTSFRLRRFGAVQHLPPDGLGARKPRSVPPVQQHRRPIKWFALINVTPRPRPRAAIFPASFERCYAPQSFRRARDAPRVMPAAPACARRWPRPSQPGRKATPR